MLYKESISDKILRTERKMKELSIQMEKIKNDYQQLLEELSLTPQQISHHINNPENFSPPIWEKIQKEKAHLDEKLNLELSQIKDPLKNEKGYLEQATIKQHWLFVR
jgi:hypothetical protein